MQDYRVFHKVEKLLDTRFVSPGLAELLTKPLIMNLLQLMTTVLRVCKHNRAHTRKLRVTE